jgi:hypothetical protein
MRDLRLLTLVLGCLLAACGERRCDPASCDHTGADAGLDAGVTDAGIGPVLVTDRATLGFGQAFGSGTYLGTSPQESVQLTNSGDAALVISSATLTGDPEFTKTGPLKTTLQASESTFIQVVFTPTVVGRYSASLEIVSNVPTKTIAVSGCGIGTDGGRPDGGC